VDPNSGWENWLEIKTPHGTTYLNQFIQDVRNATRNGIYLDPIQVQLVVNSHQVDQKIKYLSREANQWLINSRNRHGKIFRTSQVWQELVRPPDGKIYKLIAPVAANQQSEYSDVLQDVKHWRNRSIIEKESQNIDCVLRKQNGIPIVGIAREQFINWIKRYL
jgi:hypothetical protein